MPRMVQLLRAIAPLLILQNMALGYDLRVNSLTTATVGKSGQTLSIKLQMLQSVSYNSVTLHLLGKGKTNTITSIDVNPRLSKLDTGDTATVDWVLPDFIPTASYWIAVTRSGSSFLMGFGPYVEGLGYDQVSFRVEYDGCQSHGECPSNQYCDADRYCYECSACSVALDAFDNVCPTKCGGEVYFAVGSSIPEGAEPDAVGYIKDVILPETAQHAALSRYSGIDELAVSFASQNKMTQRLADKLLKLARLVKDDNRFSAILRVEKAYEAPPAGVDKATATYHHEGRAVELALNCASCADVKLMGELARLAASAGFDWVTLRDADTVYASVTPDGCTSPIDLVFLLDASSSIENPASQGVPGNFVDKELAFVKAIVPFFDVGAALNQTRVGVVSFSTQARIEFKLNEFQSVDETLTAIDDIDYMTGWTRTSEALSMVRRSMFQESAGMRPDVAGIPRVLVVVTDGGSNPGYAPYEEAALIHEQAITAFTVGVGKGPNLDELKAIASDPDTDHVYLVKSFSRIYDVVDQITYSACDTPATLQCGSTVDILVADGGFSYFSVPEGGSFIQVTVTTSGGEVNIFASSSVSTPGPFVHDIAATAGDIEQSLVVPTSPGSGTQVFFGIKGVGSEGRNTATVSAVCLLYPPPSAAPTTLPTDSPSTAPTTSPTVVGATTVEVASTVAPPTAPETTVVTTAAASTTVVTTPPTGEICPQLHVKEDTGNFIAGVYKYDATAAQHNGRPVYTDDDEANNGKQYPKYMIYWARTIEGQYRWNIGPSFTTLSAYLSEDVATPEMATSKWTIWNHTKKGDGTPHGWAAGSTVQVRCYATPSTCPVIQVAHVAGQETMPNFKFNGVYTRDEALSPHNGRDVFFFAEGGYSSQPGLYLYFLANNGLTSSGWYFRETVDDTKTGYAHLGFDEALSPVDAKPTALHNFSITCHTLVATARITTAPTATINATTVTTTTRTNTTRTSTKTATSITTSYTTKLGDTSSTRTGTTATTVVPSLCFSGDLLCDSDNGGNTPPGINGTGLGAPMVPGRPPYWPAGGEFGGGGGPTPTVPENASVGYSVLTVNAPYYYGSREPLANVTYALQPTGEEEGSQRLRRADGTTPIDVEDSIAINKTTGMVYVSGALDYETKPLYLLTVEVTAPGDRRALPFNRTIEVPVVIEAVLCPEGVWSSTGTYPCEPHTVCLPPQNETSPPNRTADRVCARESAVGVADDGDDWVWLWILLAVLILLCCVALLLAALKKNRAEDQADEEAAESKSALPPFERSALSRINEERVPDSEYLAPTPDAFARKGANHALNDAVFLRVVAYDNMYHGNKSLALPDEAVKRVYRYLQLPCPNDPVLASHRTSTRQLLDSEIKPGSCDGALADAAAEFIDRAIADVLVDRAIDCFATLRVPSADYDRAMGAEMTDKYVPQENPFLEPTPGMDSIRQLRQPVEYGLAGQSAGTAPPPEYDTAVSTQPNMVGAPLYEQAGLLGESRTQSYREPEYSMAGTGSPLGQHQEPLYNTACGAALHLPGGEEPLYNTASGAAVDTMAHTPEHPYELSSSAASPGARYQSAAQGGSGPLYEQAGAGAGSAFTASRPVYGEARAGTTLVPTGPATYDMAAGAIATARGADMYDNRDANPCATDGYDEMKVAPGHRADPTYSLAVDGEVVQGRTQSYGTAVEPPAAEAMYALGNQGYSDTMRPPGLPTTAQPGVHLHSVEGPPAVITQAFSTAVDYDVASSEVGVAQPLYDNNPVGQLQGGPRSSFEDNQFVADSKGDSLRLASVRRANPVFRDSVFIRPGDQIDDASMDAEEDA